MTIHGAGFSARSGARNNDKTTVAEKSILLAMCHYRPASYRFRYRPGHYMETSSACAPKT